MVLDIRFYIIQGVTRVKIEKIGLKCTDWAQLFFEDVRVPASNILGKEGDGFKQIMVQVNEVHKITHASILNVLKI